MSEKEVEKTSSKKETVKKWAKWLLTLGLAKLLEWLRNKDG